MLGITPFGMFHTILGLIAVVLGFAALFRYGQIGMSTRAGSGYVWFTVATCITGFFIFHRGGFGKPHILGIVTLVVLAIACLSERRGVATVAARYVAPLLYTLTLFFHFIPGYTETLSRVPVEAPYVSGPDDPKLLRLVGGTFAVFLIGMAVQALRIRARTAKAPHAGTVPR